jgi:4-hydroxy-3-polyprenylbenzoate decarboxylase
MDVLDHSCSKFSFGGKMCVDATRKTVEELRIKNFEFRFSNTSIPVESPAADQPQKGFKPFRGHDDIKEKFPEIGQINSSLLSKGISVVFISVEKNRKGHIKELNQKLFTETELKQVKIIIYLEHSVDANDLKDAIWRFTNNIDPRRDSYVVEASDAGSISHIGFDGTRKTKAFDDFDREWPNIIAADEATIKAVDEKWNKLGLGEFIVSPSLKYRKQLYSGGAVAIE